MESSNSMPVKKIGDAFFIFKHTIITRIMHALHMISMILLILTGFQIYSPARFVIFPTLEMARYIHFIFMYLIIAVMVYKIYYTIVTGEIKELIFRWRDLMEMPALIKHYIYGIFTGAKKKDWGKYNPGQRLVYSMWPFMLLAQAITGIAMYFTQSWSSFNNLFGGLQNIRFIHFILCWLFVITTAAHFYLGSTGPKVLDFYKSVVTGWEKHTAEKK